MRSPGHRFTAGEGQRSESFEQFLLDVISKGEAVNTLFEEKLFHLAGLLHKITDTFNARHIPHELIGGLAVLIYVEEASPEHAATTRDVDLLVHRSDLDRIQKAAAEDGFRFRHAAGLDMLIYGPVESARNAVHLLYAGEKVTPAQATPNPTINPAHKYFHGKTVLVIPIADLLRMKLSSYRLKDQVHVKAMEAAGLITPDAESALTPELAARLKHVRETE